MGTAGGFLLAAWTYWLSEQRKFQSNKAVLAVDMSALIRYAYDCFRLTKMANDVIKRHQARGDPPDDLEHSDENFLREFHGVPTLSETQLVRMAGATTGWGGQREMVEIIHAYQVQNARLQDHLLGAQRRAEGHDVTESVSDQELENRKKDAITLVVLANRQFDRLRGGFNFAKMNIPQEELERATFWASFRL